MVAYIFNWVNMAKFPFYLLFRKGISKKQQKKSSFFESPSPQISNTSCEIWLKHNKGSKLYHKENTAYILGKKMLTIASVHKPCNICIQTMS